MGKFIFIVLASFLYVGSSVVYADVDDVINQLNSEPYEIPKASGENNQEVFSRYCTGEAYSLKRPTPKYNNSLVKNAAKILKQTEVDANNRLKEMFADSWEGTINSIKENLGKLKTSTNPVIVNLSEKLEKSLDINATKFSKQQDTWYETIVESNFVDIKASLAELKDVVQEFKGVDYKKLQEMVTSFKKMIAGELQVVDLPKLKTLSLSFSTEIKTYEGVVDSSAILEALKVVKTEFKNIGKLHPSSDFVWAAEDIKYTIDQLESDPDNLEYVNYTIEDILYRFSGEDSNNPAVEFSEEALAQATVLRGELIKLKVAADLANIGLLVENIDNYLGGTVEFREVRYSAQDLQSSLANYVKESSNQKFIDDVDAFDAEVAAFSSENLKGSVNAILAILKDTDPLNDVQAASQAQSLSYEIDDVKVLLSEATIAKYIEIELESSKIEENNVQKTLSEMVELSSTHKALEFLDAVSWKIRSLSEDLDKLKGSLSQDAQAKVVNFAVLVNDFNSISDLRYVMSNDVELKKAGHFYFYGAVKRIYKTDSGSLPYGRTASRFLVQLCGEFRDRATMIEAKLKWIGRLYTLPKEQFTTSIDFKKNIWAQMSAEDYYPYLDVTRTLWEARLSAKERYISIGKYTSIDNPIEGPTVCETKYIFEKYVKKGKSFDDLETYTSDYEENYRQLCSSDDQVDYYDFRGDSNFKHYSPESNGMIWKATSIARACKSQWKAYSTVSGQPNRYTDEDCQNYFKSPFYYRYNAARSALATGLFYDSKYDNSFDSQGNNSVNIYTHMYPHMAPYSYETSDSDGVTESFAQDWLDLQSWNQSDMGFNEFTKLGSADANMELAYERLRGSVDRHTNWYSAGYNDGNGVVKGQAFSPFVASSYVMSASDEFTTCGITVQCPPDGLKRWMFVFRVKPQNWYNPQRILDGDTVDFDKMWFDETSFGDSGLANGESAWDRMGTAMEEELDSILYLINVGREEWGGHHGDIGLEEGAG